MEGNLYEKLWGDGGGVGQPKALGKNLTIVKVADSGTRNPTNGKGGVNCHQSSKQKATREPYEKEAASKRNNEKNPSSSIPEAFSQGCAKSRLHGKDQRVKRGGKEAATMPGKRT